MPDPHCSPEARCFIKSRSANRAAFFGTQICLASTRGSRFFHRRMDRYARLESLAQAEITRLRSQLPAEVQAILADLPVHLQSTPDADVAEEFGADLLGLFSGEALHERGETLLPTPPQIHLYLEAIWDEAGGETEAFKEEVRITFLHELGHYLGWDEDDMEAHGID
jgi:predicted Zn-dependent protease with MMP-like domain